MINKAVMLFIPGNYLFFKITCFFEHQRIGPRKNFIPTLRNYTFVCMISQPCCYKSEWSWSEILSNAIEMKNDWVMIRHKLGKLIMIALGYIVIKFIFATTLYKFWLIKLELYLLFFPSERSPSATQIHSMNFMYET